MQGSQRARRCHIDKFMEEDIWLRLGQPGLDKKTLDVHLDKEVARAVLQNQAENRRIKGTELQKLFRLPFGKCDAQRS